MSQYINDKPYSLIVGMGATGYSIAQHLKNKGEAFHIFDTRTSCLMEKSFARDFPNAQRFFVDIDETLIRDAHEVYISPGVARDEEIILKALEYGKTVVGDIELFLREIAQDGINKPVIGITGSNGKSTVTTMLGLVLQEAGKKVAVGGNIGIPALELLKEDADIYVLELSSFQLESTLSANLYVACNLNISADHMDRYDSVSSYVMAKQRIFFGAKNAVYFLDDPLTRPPVMEGMQRYGFGLEHGFCEQPDFVSEHSTVEQESIEQESIQQEYSVTFCPNNGKILVNGEAVLAKGDIKLKGIHNIKNAMAVIAMAHAADISFDACKSILASFAGLSHRCEIVAQNRGITFINDSKATNVGASQAAINGLAAEFDRIVLIAGGEGKGADFDELGKSIQENVAELILLGKDASKIASVCHKQTSIHYVDDMMQAVQLGNELANEGDAVLLSPACASFDMFSSFEERGNVFAQCVHNLIKGQV